MWILDASVVVKWFFIDEPLRNEAIKVREALVQNTTSFIVPHLFFSELVHVLSRKSGKNPQFVQEALNIILSLGLPTIFLNKEALMNAAQFSCEGLSGYDATYLGLAKQLNARWITADYEAVKKAPAELALTLASWAK